MGGHPYLAGRPLAFAHRGGAAEQPENTVRAFAAAVDLGFRHLETDVRTTADGEVVAFHDPTLDRVAGRPGRIARLPWREVRAARVDGTEPVPRFDDLLGAWPEARWNVDVKDARSVATAVDVVRRHRAQDRVCLASFSERRLHAARAALGPSACTAVGPAGIVRLRLGALAARAPGHVGGLCAQVPLSALGARIVDAAFIRAAHHAGVAVHVWTIDDPVEMARLLALGVDGIMTDRPTVLRAVLQARGQWPS